MIKMTKADQRAFIDSIDLSTRKKRRQAASLAAHFLGLIHLQELEYQDRIPPNLQSGDAYAAADETIEMLLAAMDYLMSAYE
jgi:hypothetical protein